MKSWQSLRRVEVYMNHVFICEKSEEEHDVRLKHVQKRNVACRTKLKLMCASTNLVVVIGSCN